MDPLKLVKQENGMRLYQATVNCGEYVIYNTYVQEYGKTEAEMFAEAVKACQELLAKDLMDTDNYYCVSKCEV